MQLPLRALYGEDDGYPRDGRHQQIGLEHGYEVVALSLPHDLEIPVTYINRDFYKVWKL